MAVRATSISNLYRIEHKTFDFEAPWSEAFGEHPSRDGAWIVWGAEKNGKTWFSLMLAKYLSTFDRALYISGEEGKSLEFVASCKRAGITTACRNLNIVDYEPLEEIEAMLKKRNAPKAVFFDNLTIYADELKNGNLKRLLNEFPKTLFVFIAHEDRGEPYTATAKLARRLAKIIVHVRGLKATVSGRCKGGDLIIDDERATLYYGNNNRIE